MPAEEPRSLFEVLALRACQAGSVAASLDDVRPCGRLGARLTYKELHGAACTLEGALRSLVEASQAVERCPVVATRMRRGNEWYSVFFAACKLQVPLVALSVDLPDKAVESKRNTEILAEHKPLVLIVDDDALDGDLEGIGCRTRALRMRELWELAESQAAQPAGASAQRAVPSREATLCFCYTGGTTEASRCVRITHGMALHEVASYPLVVSMSAEDRVLQQHSLYWGASAYGEVDIALAFGCTLVFCEAWDIDGVSAKIVANQATCAGLVPSILASVDPKEVPTLRVVFTWGEALQAKVALDWASRVHLVDLLISTECWLSFFADWTKHARRPAASTNSSGLGSPEFRTVPGTQVRVQKLEDSDPSSKAGELLIAGAMVTPGYTDPERNAAVLVQDANVRWYCTRDCVEPRGDGYVFAGRADDLVKVGGVWVDVREIEQKMTAESGVQEARILRKDVFAVVGSLHEGTVQRLRQILPPDFALYLVPSLPRRAGTEKVDRRRLAEAIEHRLATPSLQREVSCCDKELSQLRRWFLPLLLLAALCLLRAGIAQWSADATLQAVASESMTPPFLVVLRFMTLVALRALWEYTWRMLCLAYIQLAFFTIQLQLRRKIAGCCNNYFPFGLQSAQIVLVAALPGCLAGAFFAFPGVVKAVRRGRLFSWPLVFVVGFPVWARESGRWWVEKGARGALRWYKRSAQRRLASLWESCCGAPLALVSGAAQKSLAALWEAYWRLAFSLRMAERCNGCKQRFTYSKGYADPSVDPFWYCEDCWQHYYRHKHCAVCDDWATRGRIDPETGKWTCNRCSRKIKAVQSAASESVVRDLEEPLLPGSQTVASQPTERPAVSSGANTSNGNFVRHYGHVARDNNSNSNSANGSGGYDKWCNRTRHDVLRRTLELDILDLTQHVGSSTDTHVNVQPLGPAAAGDGRPCSSTTEAKSAEWMLIERATGWKFSSLGDSLASLDSLRTAKIASALLREVGLRLPRQALRQCSTLGELVDAIVRERGRLVECDIGGGSIDEERAIWGLMWNSKCQWTLRRDRPLQETVLRAALGRLVERHAALRARLADPMDVFIATQQAFTAFETWRSRRRRMSLSSGGAFQRLLRGALNLAVEAVQWSFKNGWPRVGTNPPGSLPLHVMQHSADLEGAKRALWRMPRFEPPFQIGFAPFDEGALLDIRVTHMLSDGYCLMPLLADLAHFVALEEAAAGFGPPLAPPPPLPSALAVTESRIMRTINGHMASNDAPTLDPISQDSHCKRESATVLTTIPPEVVSGIRRTAQSLAVSDDIVMLAAVGATLARFENAPVVPISLVVPQRDGPGESDMVGLFADVRIISVRTEGFSLAGLVLWLHNVVRERQWRAPPHETQHEVSFVNFEWTDFESRHGFTQFVQCRDGQEFVQNPLKVAVDQPDRHSWRTRMGFDTKVYDQERRSQFLALFDKHLKGLLTDPLEMIWSE